MSTAQRSEASALTAGEALIKLRAPSHPGGGVGARLKISPALRGGWPLQGVLARHGARQGGTHAALGQMLALAPCAVFVLLFGLEPLSVGSEAAASLLAAGVTGELVLEATRRPDRDADQAQSA